jgi:ketosteroid isomerase-like protein
MSSPSNPSWSVAPVMLVTLALFLAAAGCHNSPDQPANAARFEKELKEADRQFAKEVAAATAADRGRMWADWFSPDGRQIIPGQVVEGTRSIADLMGPAFASEDFMLTWEPDLASASAAGDMGWTSGRYESRGSTGSGATMQAGRYLTIWRRQADGAWKVALDTGVPDPGE